MANQSPSFFAHSPQLAACDLFPSRTLGARVLWCAGADRETVQCVMTGLRAFVLSSPCLQCSARVLAPVAWLAR